MIAKVVFITLVYKTCQNNQEHVFLKAVINLVHFQVLTSVKASEIEATLSTVNAEQLDILMKYIYKAMETSQDGQTCAQLLAWHSQVLV